MADTQTYSNETVELYLKAIDLWGMEAQINQLVEEQAEVITAVNHYRRGRITLDKLIEEMVDASICLEQMSIVMPDWKSIKDKKLARLKSLVEKEKNDV